MTVVISSGLALLSLMLGTGPGAIGMPPERFVGGLMGVSADVELCFESRHALVRLRGVPLGGTLEGRAEFADSSAETTSGEVVLHEPLKSALRRRFVSIVSAEFVGRDEVHLVVRLPLILGVRSIVLKRVPNKHPSAACAKPLSM